MRQFVELQEEERNRLLCEAVAAVEGVPAKDVLVKSLGYIISASEGVMPDVNVRMAFAKGKIIEGEYTMRWNAEKERFVKLFIMSRRMKAYVVRDSRSVFDPLRQEVTGEYVDFAVAHVMRELGYRGRTFDYFVKAKGEKPKRFSLHHDDYNGYRHFFPNMGAQRSVLSLKPYDKEGYICAAPSDRQIEDFCKKMEINAYTTTEEEDAFVLRLDMQKVLRNLIKAYRRHSGFTDAFRRYSHRI